MPSLAQSINPKPGPDSLAYWLQPLKSYFDRQGKLAREGWNQADQGANQVRQGDLPMGLANMLLGPVNYVSSPVNALLPTEEATRDFGRSVGGNFGEAVAAGGLGLAAMALPGPDIGKSQKLTVFHGSPHSFDTPDFSKPTVNYTERTGGTGGYAAATPEAARAWAGSASPNVYKWEVDASAADLIDLDKTLAEQPTKVRDALLRAGYVGGRDRAIRPGGPTAREFVKDQDPDSFAKDMRANGVKGGVFSGGDGSPNYVFYDPRDITQSRHQ